MSKKIKLILKCQKKDKKAFNDLYKVYSPFIYGICLRYTRDRSEADDLMQECFIIVLNKIEEYKFLGSFEGWLRKLTINTAINYLNVNKRVRNDEYGISSLSVESDTTDVLMRMQVEDIVRLINRLPDKCRIVFNLHVVEGYRLIEISEMLKINENTCRSLYKKARELLMMWTKNII